MFELLVYGVIAGSKTGRKRKGIQIDTIKVCAQAYCGCTIMSRKEKINKRM
jgi:hypothetical protein